MIKRSDIKTTVRYDLPYPGYVEVEARLEMHEVASIREKDIARQNRLIEDAKHICTRQLWNKLYDRPTLRGLIADLEYIALMNLNARQEETREIIKKIHEVLEGLE